MFSTSTLISKMRGEYESLPGLKLTREQACRLWAVDEETCEIAFDALISEGFLHRTGTGKFIALPRPSGFATASRASRVRCPHCQKLNTMEQGAFRCVACRRLVTFAPISA